MQLFSADTTVFFRKYLKKICPHKHKKLPSKVTHRFLTFFNLLLSKKVLKNPCQAVYFFPNDRSDASSQLFVKDLHQITIFHAKDIEIVIANQFSPLQLYMTTAIC